MMMRRRRGGLSRACLMPFIGKPTTGTEEEEEEEEEEGGGGIVELSRVFLCLPMVSPSFVIWDLEFRFRHIVANMSSGP